MRIELTALAWEARVLPLYDARVRGGFYGVLPEFYTLERRFYKNIFGTPIRLFIALPRLASSECPESATGKVPYQTDAGREHL